MKITNFFTLPYFTFLYFTSLFLKFHIYLYVFVVIYFFLIYPRFDNLNFHIIFIYAYSCIWIFDISDYTISIRTMLCNVFYLWQLIYYKRGLFVAILFILFFKKSYTYIQFHSFVLFSSPLCSSLLFFSLPITSYWVDSVDLIIRWRGTDHLPRTARYSLLYPCRWIRGRD